MQKTLKLIKNLHISQKRVSITKLFEIKNDKCMKNLYKDFQKFSMSFNVSPEIIHQYSFPTQPSISEGSLRSDCGQGKVNMVIVPLLNAKESPEEEQKEEGVQQEQTTFYQEDSINTGPAIYKSTETPETSPETESSLVEEARYLEEKWEQDVQNKEDKLLLGLKSLNCSTEFLESVEKFLS